MATPFAQAPTSDVGVPDLSWGTWGQGLLSDWWETAADLIWPQSVVTYGRMRHDPQLKQVMSALVMPIMRATWAVDPLGARGQVVQRCADDCGLPILGKDPVQGSARRRGVIWRRHLRQALDHLIYGHMPFELRYEIVGSQPGDCHLIHLGARMPWTIAQINLAKDSTVDHIVQTTQQEPIPGDRLVWYSYNQEGANWAGISALRPAFGAWLLKHETWRVHATSIRRFGMGVPTVTAPPGATQAQVTDAQAMASAMRAGDQSGAGVPFGFQFALEGLHGSVPDALAFIRYLDQQMAGMVLTQGLLLGQTETGSRALGESFLDLYLLALQSIADEIATTATSGQESMPGIVTDLVDQNWGEDEPCPAIVCTDVGESYEITAEAIATLTRYGALSPDATLDDWIRKVWRMPRRDTMWQPTHMGVPAPGQPGGAFLPAGATPAPLTPIAGADMSNLEPAWEAPAPPAPAPALPPGAPAPAPAKPGSPAQPPAAARSARAAKRTDGLRRNMTPAEIRAGFNPLAMQQQWTEERARLVELWKPVFAAQRDSLVDQIVERVDKGQIAKLAALSVDTTAGADLLAAAMYSLAQRAADQMLAEGAANGKHVPPSRVKISESKLGKVAKARAAMHGAYVAAQASKQALQVVQATAGSDAGDYVLAHLTGLSDVSLRDELGAALSAAQNAGRTAVLDAASAWDPSADYTYTATEILDHNTCQPCEDIDGTQFADLAEAEAAYANGGYIECEGGLRCRGTLITDWAAGPGADEQQT